jgi:hypothetical protein
LASSCQESICITVGDAPAMKGHARRPRSWPSRQQFDVGRAVVEVVVADQAAEGLAAELAELFFVDLLEQRALVPGRALVALERLAQVLLGDVHHPDLEHLVGLGVVDQVVQAAPGAFELLEVLVVQDLVDLLDSFLSMAAIIASIDLTTSLPISLVCDSACCASVCTACSTALGFVGLGLEFLLQQRREVAAFEGDAASGEALVWASAMVVLLLFE